MSTRVRPAYWHYHHATLLEGVIGGHEEAKDRRLSIYKYKPNDQRQIRLLLFQPVKGKLPEAVKKNLNKGMPWNYKIGSKAIAEVNALHKKECQDCCPMLAGMPQICPAG